MGLRSILSQVYARGRSHGQIQAVLSQDEASVMLDGAVEDIKDAGYLTREHLMAELVDGWVLIEKCPRRTDNDCHNSGKHCNDYDDNCNKDGKPATLAEVIANKAVFKGGE